MEDAWRDRWIALSGQISRLVIERQGILAAGWKHSRVLDPTREPCATVFARSKLGPRLSYVCNIRSTLFPLRVNVWWRQVGNTVGYQISLATEHEVILEYSVKPLTVHLTQVGNTVGYQIRLESRRSDATRLLFCTTGISHGFIFEKSI